MADPLPGPEAGLAGGRFHRYLRTREFLATRGKKLGNIVDGVVFRAGVARAAAGAALLAARHRALIFVFIAVVHAAMVGLSLAAAILKFGAAISPLAIAIFIKDRALARAANIFDQLRRNFFQEARRYGRLRQVT